jgi:hypothetical protein
MNVGVDHFKVHNYIEMFFVKVSVFDPKYFEIDLVCESFGRFRVVLEKWDFKRPVSRNSKAN